MTIEIQKDFQKGLTIKEVCNKYKMSFKDIVKLIRSQNPQGTYESSEKYIYKYNNRWTIIRKINQKRTVFGSYIDFKEAKKVKNELEQLNWQVNPQDYLGDRYIHKEHKAYKIIKHNGKKSIRYGTYHDLKTARKVRDMLIECNWNKENLPKIKKELGVDTHGNN